MVGRKADGMADWGRMDLQQVEEVVPCGLVVVESGTPGRYRSVA